MYPRKQYTRVCFGDWQLKRLFRSMDRRDNDAWWLNGERDFDGWNLCYLFRWEERIAIVHGKRMLMRVIQDNFYMYVGEILMCRGKLASDDLPVGRTPELVPIDCQPQNPSEESWD